MATISLKCLVGNILRLGYRIAKWRHWFMFGFLIKKLFTKFLIFFWLAVTSPPVLLVAWFFQTHENLRAGLGVFGFIIILTWFFGSWWLGMTTTHYMFDEKKMFLKAVKCTFSDLRFKLAFMPIFGAWFAPNEDKTKNDDDEA